MIGPFSSLGIMTRHPDSAQLTSDTASPESEHGKPSFGASPRQTTRQASVAPPPTGRHHPADRRNGTARSGGGPGQPTVRLHTGVTHGTRKPTNASTSVRLLAAFVPRTPAWPRTPRAGRCTGKPESAWRLQGHAHAHPTVNPVTRARPSSAVRMPDTCWCPASRPRSCAPLAAYLARVRPSRRLNRQMSMPGGAPGPASPPRPPPWRR